MAPLEDAAIVWDLPEPFTVDVVVSAQDIDEYGHTNNAVYLSWCDRVAWAHTAAVGLGARDHQRMGRAMVARRTHIEHLGPSLAGERIRVGNWIVFADGRLRATRRYQICRVTDGLTLVRAITMFVCIDLGTGRPRRWPAEFRERYVVLPSVQQALARVASPFEAIPGR